MEMTPTEPKYRISGSLPGPSGYESRSEIYSRRNTLGWAPKAHLFSILLIDQTLYKTLL